MQQYDIDVLIIFHRYNLIMGSVSKIINNTMDVKSKLIKYDTIIEEDDRIEPKLLIIDQTVISHVSEDYILYYNKKFPDSKVLVITIDDEFHMDGNVGKWENIEILNLWNKNLSLSKSLIIEIKNRLKS
jgi:hypothetical protein